MTPTEKGKWYKNLEQDIVLLEVFFFYDMKIQVNNKETETSALNVATLAEELALPERGVAIAVNNCMVPRDAWTEFGLHEGDQVVIIKAACGG